MSDSYFQRFAFCERQILARPATDLGLVVVIPCFNEPDLLASLSSLWQCQRPGCAVEVIVVINSAINSNAEIRAQNLRTLEQARAWVAEHFDPRLAFHVLHFPDLAAKKAGVGLARKIGMDEAARRFDEIRCPLGVIAGFDADCRCEANYLVSIEQHFQNRPQPHGCSIYFEHPLHTDGGPIDEAIAAYELHLRYYLQALRYAGFPYAHHTLGSCMAVRADIYKAQGGMNTRRAGEDFYFLQKIIPLGQFSDLTQTTVIPSARPSERVPFGTGKAVRDYLNHPDQQSRTYPLQAFVDLKHLFQHWPELFSRQDSRKTAFSQMPKSLGTFLQGEEVETSLEEIGQNSASERTRRNRFFHWFNGFRTMKFIHHARDDYYGAKYISEEARSLLLLKEIKVPGQASVRELLNIYRRLERELRQKS